MLAIGTYDAAIKVMSEVIKAINLVNLSLVIECVFFF